MKRKTTSIPLVVLGLALSASAISAVEVTVVNRSASEPVNFALRKLEGTLVARGDVLVRSAANSAASSFVVRTEVNAQGTDDFAPTREGRTLVVSGGGARGTMYGVLDVAEQIRLGTPLENIESRTVRASLSLRAIKFNLPFAAYRNAPYLEQHQATCEDLTFWEAFLDMMAENRFNTLTLWSLHPFQFMVVPKSFPGHLKRGQVSPYTFSTNLAQSSGLFESWLMFMLKGVR